jgi:hypothetical protein
MNSSVFSPWRGVRLLGYVLAVALIVAPTAVAQVQTGNVFGTVTDSSGSPLPGVTVTLSGVGAPRIFVTNAQGDFRFLSLSPGTYDIRAELAGFGTAARSNVAVNIARNTSVDMTLQPAVAQTITVTAETPLLDVRRAGTGATVTRVELESVPSGRDPWVILQQVPGVLMDRINVGGSESGQQSQFVSKGAEGDQATFNVDGVNITDMAATGSSPAYYDFDAFEEIQVTTGGTDPRIMTPGAQLNMVTKRGTNELRGSGRYMLTDGEWQTDPVIPEEARGYLAAVNEIEEITDMGFELGGPILRDRLWLWGAYSDQQIDLLVAQPFGQARRFFDRTTLETLNFKANAQILDNNSLAGIWTDSAKVKLGRDASPSRPPETTFNQDGFGPEGIWKIEDTHIFSPSFYLTGMYSKVNGGFQLIGATAANCTTMDCLLTQATNPARFDIAGGGWREAFVGIEILRPQDQYRLDGSTFFDTGAMNHELKFGFGYRETPWNTRYAWPFDHYFIDYTGLAPSLQGFGGVYLFRGAPIESYLDYTDLYLGDTMLWGNLTIQAGLRFDSQNGSTGAGSVAAQPLVPDLMPAASFDGATIGEMEWESINPRLGVTYALGGTRRTLLRGSYNRYADQMGAGEVITNPLYYQYLYMYFVDANGNKRVEPGEIIREGGPFGNGVYGFYNIDPNNPTTATITTRYGDDIEPPTTDEFILGFEHELAPEFTVGLNYTHRNIQDFLQTIGEKTPGAGDFYVRDDYVQGGVLTGNLPPCNPAAAPAPITPCTGPAYSVPFFVLKPGIDPPSSFVVRNRPDYERVYDGLELNLIKRLSNRWMMRGSFTWNDWTQNQSADSIADPTERLVGYGCSSCDGSTVVQGSGGTSGTKNGIYINSAWSYTITGLYQIPVVDVNFGFNVIGREGYPIPSVHAKSGTSEGTKNVLVQDIGDSRHEDPFNLDLRLSKELRFRDIGLTLSIDAFNVTDEQTILQRNLLLGTTNAAGTFTRSRLADRMFEQQSPRVFRAGARLSF